MPKESYLPPLLIFPKKKEKKKNAEGTAASYFSAKNSETITSSGLEAAHSSKNPFFQRVPFSVPALIFEPIKL